MWKWLLLSKKEIIFVFLIAVLFFISVANAPDPPLPDPSYDASCSDDFKICYDNNDGTKRARLSPYPLTFIDKQGKRKIINTNIQNETKNIDGTDYNYIVENNTYSFYGTSKFNQPDSKVVNNKYHHRFYLNPQNIHYFNGTDTQTIASKQNSDAEVIGNVINYTQAFGQYQMIYKVWSNEVQSFVYFPNNSLPQCNLTGTCYLAVFEKFSKNSTVKVSINNKDWDEQSKEQTNDSIIFYHTNGTENITDYVLPKPYAFNDSTKIFGSYEIKKTGQDLGITKYIADYNVFNSSFWFEPTISINLSSSTNFIIDSTANQTDADVSTITDTVASVRLDTASNLSNRRYYVKGNISGLNAASIISGSIELEADVNRFVNFNFSFHEVYRGNINYSSDRMTWNNQLCGNSWQNFNSSCNGTALSWLSGISLLAGERGNWSITQALNNSLNSSNELDGIFAVVMNATLQGSTNNQLFSFYSSEAGSNNEPQLYITYVPNEAPQLQFVSPTPNDNESTIAGYALPINITSTDPNGDNISTFIDITNASGAYSLRLYFSMDNSTGDSILRDNSTWGNNATDSLAECTRSTQAKFGSGCEFRRHGGQNSYARINYTNSLKTEEAKEFTLDFWFYPRSIQDSAIFSQTNNTPNTYSGIIALWSGKLDLYMNSAVRSTCPASNWPLNQWHHATLRWNGTHTAIFKNGTLCDEDLYSTPPLITQANSIIGGYPQDGRDTGDGNNIKKFNGTIDELKFFYRALTPLEINASAIGANIIYNNFSLSQTTNGTYSYYGYSVDTKGAFNKTEVRRFKTNFTVPNVYNLSHAPISALAGSRFIFNATVNDTDDGISNYTFWWNGTPTHLGHKYGATSSPTTWFFGDCRWRSISFTPNITGYITNITIKTNKAISSAGQVELAIYDQKSSGCGGSNPCPNKIIESARANVSVVLAGISYYTVTINNTIKVLSGANYWVVIKNATGGTNSDFRIGTNSGGEGTVRTTENCGSYWSSSSYKPEMTVRIGEFKMVADPSVTISGTDPVQISVTKTAQYKGSFNQKICAKNLVSAETCSNERNFIVVNDTDLTAPTVTSMSPNNNTFVNGNVSIKIKCLDNNKCNYVEMYYRENNTGSRFFYKNASSMGGNVWEIIWDTATFNNRSNWQWNGYGVDDFSNAKHGNHFNYSIDRDLPIVNFTQVIYGEGTWGKYLENITLRVNASDPAGGTGMSNATANLSLINSTTFGNMTFISGSKTTGQYSLYSINATIHNNISGEGLEEQIIVCDQTSPSNCQTVTQIIRIDSIAPRVTNCGRNDTEPILLGNDISFFCDFQENPALSGLKNFTITHNFSGSWKNQTQDDGTSWFVLSGFSQTGVTNYTMNMTGSFSWFMWGFDQKGNLNHSEAVYNLTVIEIPDTSTFLNVTITLPVNNSVVNNGTFNISFLNKNSYKILEARLFIDGTQNNTNTTPVSANTTNLIQTLALSEGYHDIQIEVVDDHAQINQSNIFNYTVAMLPNVTISTPTNSTIIAGNVSLDYLVGDETGVSECVISLNGVNTSKNPCANETYDETELGEGTHVIIVWVNDTSNNFNQSNVSFTFRHTLLINTTLNRTGTPPSYNQTETVNSTAVFRWDNETTIQDGTSRVTFVWNDSSGNLIREINITPTTNGYAWDTFTLNTSSVTGIWWVRQIGWTTQNGTVRNIINQTSFRVTEPHKTNITLQRPTSNELFINSTFVISYKIGNNSDASCTLSVNGTNTTLATCQNRTFDETTLLDGSYGIIVYINTSNSQNNTGQVNAVFRHNMNLSLTVNDTTAKHGAVVNISVGNATWENGTTIRMNVQINWTDPSGLLVRTINFSTNNTNGQYWDNLTLNSTAKNGTWTVDVVQWVYQNTTLRMQTNKTTFTVTDVTPPVIYLQHPANITYIHANVTFNFTVGDNLSVSQCRVSINNVNNSNPTCGNFTLTEVNISDGTNVVIIWVNDSANNFNQTNISFTFTHNMNLSLAVNDTTANQGANINISTGNATWENGTTIRMNVQINWTKPDGTLARTINFSTNNTNGQYWDNFTTNSTSANGTWTVFVAQWVYQNSTIRSQTNSTTFTLSDVTPPTITIQHPTNQTYIGANITFNFTVGDNVGVSQCRVNIGATNTSNPTCGNFTLTEINLSDGSYTAIIWVNDTTNNFASASVGFTFTHNMNLSLAVNDTTANQGANINISTGNATWENGTTIRMNVQINWTDPAGLLVRTINFSTNNTNGAYWDNLTLNDTAKSGTWTVFVAQWVYQNSTLRSQTNRTTFTVTDVTVPTITIQHPTNQTYIGANITFNFTVGDNVGVSQCRVNIGATNTSNPTCGNFTLAEANLSDGSYTAIIWINDTSNNFNQSNISFTFTHNMNLSLAINDTSANQGANINITTGNATWENGTTIRMNVQINWTKPDGTLARFVNFSTNNTNGQYWDNFTTNSSSQNGTWTIFIAQWVYQNSSLRMQTNRTTFTVTDVTVPSITIQNPSNSTIIVGNVSLNYLVGDNNEVSQCSISLNNINTSSPSCNNQSYDETTLGEGSHIIIVWVNDSSNNVNQSNISFTFRHNMNLSLAVNDTTANQGANINITTGNATWENGTTIRMNVQINWTKPDGTLARFINFSTNGTNGQYWDNFTTNSTSANGTWTVFVAQWVYQNATLRMQTNRTTFTLSDVTVPSITIQEPKNTTYNISFITLNYTIGDNIGISQCTISLDGVNTSVSTCANQSYDESKLGEGGHIIIVWVNDTVNNVNQSNISFTFRHNVIGNITLNRTGIPIPHYNQTENINASVWAYWDNNTQIGNITTFIWNDTNGNIVRQINFTNNANGFASDNFTTNTSSVTGVWWVRTILWTTQNGTVRNMVNQTAFRITELHKTNITLQRPTANELFINWFFYVNYTIGNNSDASCTLSVNNTNTTLATCQNRTLDETTLSDGSYSIIVFTNTSNAQNNSGAVSASFRHNMNITLGLNTTSINQGETVNISVGNATWENGTTIRMNVQINWTKPDGTLARFVNFSTNGTNGQYWDNFTTNISSTSGTWTVMTAQWVYQNATLRLQTNRTTFTLNDITFPNITIQSPPNATNSTGTIVLNYTTNDNTGIISQCIREWTNETGVVYNKTMVNCVNESWFGNDGFHTIRMWVNDTAGNKNVSVVSFTIDTTLPSLVLQEPRNTTYSDSNITINFTSGDVNRDTCYYDDEVNTKILIACRNATYRASFGKNSFTIFVNDSAGNTKNVNVNFTVGNIEAAVPETNEGGGYINSSLEINGKIPIKEEQDTTEKDYFIIFLFILIILAVIYVTRTEDGKRTRKYIDKKIRNLQKE